MDTQPIAGLLRYAVLGALLPLLGACSSLGEKHESFMTEDIHGIAYLFAITKEEKKEAEWWHTFYGGKPEEE